MADTKHRPGSGTHGTQPNGKKRPLSTFDIDGALKQQPEWVQRELEGLKKHEQTVLRALASEENRELFMRDPAGFLRKHSIPISGPLKNRLRADPSLAELKKPVCFTLSNGQAIRPKVRINFTK